MKQKFTEKYIARKLRKKGLSYSEILKKVGVSKSSLSLWLRDIGLSEKQLENLKGRQISRYKAWEKIKLNRINRTKQILSSSIKEVDNLIDDPLFISGLMLYWAEGTKYQEAVGFSNSDPIMIELIMRWFRKICKVPEHKFRVNIHAHELHIRKDVEIHWSKITKVPLNQFHKTYIKPTSLKHRKNKLRASPTLTPNKD